MIISFKWWLFFLQDILRYDVYVMCMFLDTERKNKIEEQMLNLMLTAKYVLKAHQSLLFLFLSHTR